MGEQEDLLNQFNRSESNKLALKESSKNSVDDAKNQRDANQFKNQTKLSCFFIDWVIHTLTFFSFLLFTAAGYYIYTIMSDPIKLERLLLFIYSEMKFFVNKYQAAIAVVLTFVFGESIRSKNKDKNDGKA